MYSAQRNCKIISVASSIMKKVSNDFHWEEILCCPVCRGNVAFHSQSGTFMCYVCSIQYPMNDGIPMMFPPKMVYQEKEPLYGKYYECYKKIAEDDVRNPIEKHKEQRYVPLKRFMGNLKNARVLDIGTSQGFFLNLLQARHKIGIDIVFQYLRIAKERNKVISVAGDAEFLPFKDSSFDVVVCSDVLEHVLNPQAVIKNIYQILREGGKLFLVVPWKEDLSFYAVYKNIYEFTHLRRFDENNLSGFLEGFTVLRRKGVIPRRLYRVPYRIIKFFLHNILPSNLGISLFTPAHLMIEAIKR